MADADVAATANPSWSDVSHGMVPINAVAPDDRFVYAFVFPLRIGGVDGIVAACNTEESALAQLQHSEGRMDITDAVWLLYVCFFFAGMTPMNWSGMSDPPYVTSPQPIGTLAEVLDVQCHGRMGNWRGTYASFRGRPYLTGLREFCCAASVYQYGSKWPVDAVAVHTQA